MLTQERYQSIISILNERQAVTVAELSQMLDTSESTIRRDLNALDELGKIHKVFGGATAVAQNEGLVEEHVSTREGMMRDEKTAIAKYCANLVNNADFVFIDAGTTTSRLIDFLDNTEATYVTNGIVHARKLIQRGFKAYIIGGKVKPVTEAVVGAEGIANLKKMNFSKAFMGTNGIDLHTGYTTPDSEEAMIKEAVIKHSYMSFVIADHTKFRRVFPVTFSPLKKCCIITDEAPNAQFAKETIVKEVNK